MSGVLWATWGAVRNRFLVGTAKNIERLVYHMYCKSLPILHISPCFSSHAKQEMTIQKNCTLRAHTSTIDGDSLENLNHFTSNIVMVTGSDSLGMTHKTLSASSLFIKPGEWESPAYQPSYSYHHISSFIRFGAFLQLRNHSAGA